MVHYAIASLLRTRWQLHDDSVQHDSGCSRGLVRDHSITMIYARSVPSWKHHPPGIPPSECRQGGHLSKPRGFLEVSEGLLTFTLFQSSSEMEDLGISSSLGSAQLNLRATVHDPAF